MKISEIVAIVISLLSVFISAISFYYSLLNYRFSKLKYKIISEIMKVKKLNTSKKYLMNTN
jgi:NAD/NADP transhydrogenase beta subunit